MYVMAHTEESSVRPAANRGSPTTQLVELMDACQCLRRQSGDPDLDTIRKEATF